MQHEGSEKGSLYWVLDGQVQDYFARGEDFVVNGSSVLSNPSVNTLAPLSVFLSLPLSSSSPPPPHLFC